MQSLRLASLIALVLAGAALAVLPGCARKKPTQGAGDTGTNADKGQAGGDGALHNRAPATAWGHVKGQVVFAGDEVPQMKPLTIEKDVEHCLSKGKIRSEDWVVNEENRGLKWAVVWLIPDPPPHPEKNPNARLDVHLRLQTADRAKMHTVDQPCCRFEPHVTVMRQGETLLAKNSAPIAHNFKWAGVRNPGDNKLMPPNTSFEITDLKASPFAVIVECNIHEWMRAYVRVFDHPYFAVTDDNGNFEIKDAPAGKCRIVVWQETLGYKTGKNDGEAIEIKADATTDLGKLEIKPR